jgi:ATP-dependent DNA helicase RecG
LSPSNISNIHWNSKTEDLYPKGPTKSAQSLINAGFTTLKSLLWLIPIRVIQIPTLKDFSSAYEDALFTGVGKVLSVRALPSFNGRGKGRAQLLNITVVVQDIFSSNAIEIKWFNAYSSISQKFNKSKYVRFTGVVQSYQGKKQIINPEFHSLEEHELPSKQENDEILPELKIQYPTINGVNTSNIKKVIDKIPDSLWNSIKDELPSEQAQNRNLIGLQNSFKIIHAKTNLLNSWSNECYLKARDRLIYQELFDEQLKLLVRKQSVKKRDGVLIETSAKSYNQIVELFPYELTNDQKSVTEEILNDLKSSHPMMRLVQGDVGCGKTSVAIISGLVTSLSNYQCALMCPTESLALQHYQEVSEYCNKLDIRCELLLGSTSSKDKKKIQEQLKSGEILFVVGTHSLFQESTEFKNLALAIIDEQHKFGVDQRIKLVNKSQGCHCLIMTATPIPRSLSLTQFGDLDISTIKSMPSGRKGSKTKIVTTENFGQFLNFLNTRISMKEQAYIVVPAITESPNQDILNLEDVLKRFKTFFPNIKIEGMHGQMKSEEKNHIFKSFKNNEIDILIATSLIEVGINVTNATIMSVLNPERFGLSSLHQLRGRVGRGDKPGFFFLVVEHAISKESMDRLKVIEENSDGFKIAEEDLKIRGAGDVFGKDQSGNQNGKRIANLILHSKELELAKKDVQTILKESPQLLESKIKEMEKDAKIFSTV